MKLRALGTGLALTALTVAVVLVLGEVAVRAFGHVTPPLRMRDSKIGERYIEDFDAPVFVDEAGKDIRLRFNRLGFRGPDRPETKPEGTRRIAVLGDSMVAALAVEEAQTMTARLEEILAEGTGVPWEALNFGVSASSPGQALVLYRELAARFDPDVVVVGFFTGNDLSDSARALDHYPRIYFDFDEAGVLQQLPFGGAGRARSSGWLNRNSRLYVWQKHLVNQALHSAAESVKILPPGFWIYCADPPPDVEHAWKIVQGVLQKLREETEARGAELVVAVLPSGRQIYPDLFDAVVDLAGDRASSFDRDYGDRRLDEVCRAAGVRCVFMTEAFRAAANKKSASETPPDAHLFFGGTGHFTARGHQLAAEVIARDLIRKAPD